MIELHSLSSFPSRELLVQRPRGGWEHGGRRLQGYEVTQACQFSTRDNETEQLLSSGPVSLIAPVQRQSGQLTNIVFQISKKCVTQQ